MHLPPAFTLTRIPTRPPTSFFPTLPHHASYKRPRRAIHSCTTNPATSRASRPATLPASVACFRIPGRDIHVYIVGCVHGSRTSKDDVTYVLDHATPDAVVLELCPSRLRTLRTIFSPTTPPKAARRSNLGEVVSFFGGVGPAVVALFLDAVYRLQLFSGVHPGIEFAEAIRRYDRSRVICGDAPAKDTVRQLYGAFALPIHSFSECCTAVLHFLSRIIRPPHGGVHMGTLFLTDPKRAAELVRLLLPAVVIAVSLILITNAAALALDVSHLANVTASTGFVVAWTVVEVLTLAYFFVATLRFIKVLISDRDRILSASIVNTVSKMTDSTDGRVTICVVVGLLHVNGILKLLMDEYTQ